MSHSISSSLIHAEVYNSASAIPDDVWDCLRSNPLTSNILYPYATKALDLEVNRRARPSESNFWIVSYSMSRGSGSVDFVLSCTDGPLGTYPIFIWSYPGQSLRGEDLSPRIGCLIQKLLQRAGPHRVYSVFSVEPVSRMFAHLWTRTTGISIIREPYYAAKLTWCSRETLTNSRCPTPPDVMINLRVAEERDVTQVAELCRGFASTSVSPLHRISEMSPVKVTTAVIRIPSYYPRMAPSRRLVYSLQNVNYGFMRSGVPGALLKLLRSWP